MGINSKCAGTKSGTEKRDEMKKFIAGIVIGAAVATAIPALGNNFNNNQNIFSHDRAYRSAYVAGIFDVLWAIVERDYDIGTLRKQYACLDEKSTTLGPLTTWAEYKWQADSHTYNAASVVLSDACNP
jgi:hypothetical protein